MKQKCVVRYKLYALKLKINTIFLITIKYKL